MSHPSQYPFRNPQHLLQAALLHPSELYAVLQDLWSNATPPLSPTYKNLLCHVAAKVPQTQDSAGQLLRLLHNVSAQQLQALLHEETDWVTPGSGKVKVDQNNAGKEKMKKTKYLNDDDGDDDDGDDSGDYKPDPDDEDSKEYCLCRSPAYGEMIGCENEQCPYEWFHLRCVGLKEPPSATAVWYCPACRTKPGITRKMK